ncbi:MAG: LPD38 domain-containing protein, partial [Thermodesulfobacteriota bacterium]|nr:LPD38 domain-containing protein [Thermodesulfobacteriota bacterium]
KKIGGFGKREKKTIKDRFNEAKVLAGSKLRQGIIDQFSSLNSTLDDKKAHMLATLTKSDTSVLMGAINDGMPILDTSGAIDLKEGSKGLKEIFAPIGDQLDDFLAWYAAHRAERLFKEGRENRFTEDQIKAGKTLNHGRKQLFDDVSKEFDAMGAAITDIAVKTGLVNEEEAQKWIEEGFYVPFYRMLEEQENSGKGPGNLNGLTNQKPYKRLKGADLKIDDLLTNVLLNWNHLISASLRNQAGTQALESATDMGLATMVEKQFKSKEAVYVRANGKEIWYELDSSPEGQLVLDSITSLSYEGLNTPAMKAMRMFKRTLTQGVTASPGFKIRNLFRDSLHAPAVSTASKNPLKNVAVGFKYKADEKRMKMGGGAFSQEGYIHGNDPDAIKNIVGISTDSILNTSNKIKRMWRKWENFGNTLENINRVASFRADLAAGKSLLEANFNARDQLDFARSGSFTSVRFLAQTIPFINARLQGGDKVYRSLKDPEQRKQFFQVVGTYAFISAGLMTLMVGDDDYDEAPEWEKRTYHLFKTPGSDIMYRMPRPFEVGAIAYMVEQMTKKFMDENVELGSALKHTLSDTFAMSVVPQAFNPILEVYSNKDSFRDIPIESMSMKNLSKKERAKPWTSKTAKGVSAAMSNVLPEGQTLSPVQIQYLVQGYTGWAGGTTLASIDFLIKQMTGEITPEVKISEYTWNPVSSFAREKDARSSKYVTKFYDNLSELNKLWADIRKYRQTPGGIKVTNQQVNKLRYRKIYNKISKKLSTLRKYESRIYTDTTMTAAGKREAIKKIRIQKNNLTKQIVNVSKDVF